jgi:hypothetical protein
LKQSLYQEYLEVESSIAPKEWLIDRLATLFVSMGEPPKWIERTWRWPFLNGLPMTFIGSMPLPSNPVTNTRLCADAVVYVFGARVPVSHVENGWRMEYKVETQLRSLSFEHPNDSDS